MPSSHASVVLRSMHFADRLSRVLTNVEQRLNATRTQGASASGNFPRGSRFAVHPRFGYLTTLPSVVGSGLQMVVKVQLPLMATHATLASIADEHQLTVRYGGDILPFVSCMCQCGFEGATADCGNIDCHGLLHFPMHFKLNMARVLLYACLTLVLADIITWYR
jgi:hypothetical protein